VGVTVRLTGALLVLDTAAAMPEGETVFAGQEPGAKLANWHGSGIGLWLAAQHVLALKAWRQSRQPQCLPAIK
jgi:hypothetical protein